LRYFSAASFSSVVPPLAVTTFELTTDSAGFASQRRSFALTYWQQNDRGGWEKKG